jgi:hypothetical protein
MVGVAYLVQRIGDGQPQVGYLVAGRSKDWVTLSAVCTVHEEKRSTGFLVWPQNQSRQFVSGLASKPLGRFPGLCLKIGRYGLSVVWPQNHWDGFPSFGLKTGSFGLGIWGSKSPWQFLGLDLKTK